MNGNRGFTLIELLVVMTIIALLLTIAVPRYFGNVDRAKESVLRENLSTLRDTIDKFHADKGKYPATLDELVNSQYLRKVPVDPVTDGNTTWILVPPSEAGQSGIYDVRSGAKGKARDGSLYAEW